MVALTYVLDAADRVGITVTSVNLAARPRWPGVEVGVHFSGAAGGRGTPAEAARLLAEVGHVATPEVRRYGGDDDRPFETVSGRWRLLRLDGGEPLVIELRVFSDVDAPAVTG